MVHVPVITAPGFGKVPVGILQVPLSAVITGVVSRGGGGEQAAHGQNAPARILNAKIAAHAYLLQLPLVGAEHFRGPAHRVVLGTVVVKNVVGVEANLGREVLGGHGQVFYAPVAVEPGPVSGEGSFFGGNFRGEF